MIKRNFGYLALFGMLMASALQAHHSLAGVYDMKAQKELAGTLDKIQFVNPHGSLSMVVTADGKDTTWVFTMGSATALAQRGVGKTGPNALHQGDKISVKFIPAKDGAPLGFLQSITYPDGHTIVVFGGGANE